MRTFFVVLIMLGFTGLRAQHFLESRVLKLNKSVKNSTLEHADFNNDGFIDLLLLNTYEDGTMRMEFVKNDSTLGFILLHDSTDISIAGYSGVTLHDYDGDNDIDIVLFGISSVLYRNEGDFIFQPEAINLPAITLAQWADFDNNGSYELIGSFLRAGEEVTAIFRQQASGSWQQQGDLVTLSLSALEILDVNADGYKDLFISGSHQLDSLFTGFLINEKDFQFRAFLAKSWVGRATAGDLNGDGAFDVAFIGTDSTSTLTQKILLSNGNKYVIRDTAFAVVKGDLFISDLNSDGKADISTIGENISSDSVHAVLFADGISEITNISTFQSQQLLDVNRDGNLDIIRITRPDSIHIEVYQNQSVVNEGPAAPSFAAASNIFNHYFFFWAPSLDDHTDSKSLTYDLLINGSQAMQAVDFDLANERRLATRHGNNLTALFKLFDALPSAPTGFAVQAVDNSFHAAFIPTGTGLCLGTVTSCSLEAAAEGIKACPSENITIPAPHTSHWFSFKDGYLGMHSALQYSTTVSDTLFYYDPTVFDCSALKAFVVEIRNATATEIAMQFACEDERIELTVEDSWQAVQWMSELNGDLGQNVSIRYTVTENDTIVAQLSQPGCNVVRKTTIRVSKPEITVEDANLAILKGTSVELHAFGGERYEWMPAESLSDALIANPVASPLATTRYTVTGYDSIGCTAEAMILVTVESAGFVPTLFTPNEDGKNDELKIYGLREVRGFSFTVLNREGKIVYETRSVLEAASQGWDGRQNGQRQPTGVYYWKVKGSHPSGEVVRLNGKSEGSIILVR